MKSFHLLLSVVFLIILTGITLRVQARRSKPQAGDIRLVGGPHRCEGRLEVYTNYFDGRMITWAQACNANFKLKDAKRACRKLNCGYSMVNITDIEEYGYGDRSEWLTCYPSFAFCQCFSLDILEETSYVGLICSSVMVEGSVLIIFCMLLLSILNSVSWCFA